MRVPMAVKPQWDEIDKHAPWSHVSSRELSKLLNVSLNTINNYKMRDIIVPVEQSRFKGNRNYYNVAYIRAWLESKSEEEITWTWIDKHIPDYNQDIVEPAVYFIKICYDVLDIHKPLV